MISTTWTAVPAGLPATGSADVRPRLRGSVAGSAAQPPVAAAPGDRSARGARRVDCSAPGRPAPVVRRHRVVARTPPAPSPTTDIPTTNGTTLGIHAPRRPLS